MLIMYLNSKNKMVNQPVNGKVWDDAGVPDLGRRTA